MPCPSLVLASSSPYRKDLLSRLGLPFTTASPNIDERARTDEPADALATRLAEDKARALATRFPDHWIIGSDQVAALPDGTRLNKPGDHCRAVKQLAASSGQIVTFYTGLALLNSETGQLDSMCEPFRVQFRNLSDDEIDHYLSLETPYDCAGSFKMEGLGIALFQALEGRDPNSLIGLPLIALSNMLRAWGLNPLAEAYRISRRDSMS